MGVWGVGGDWTSAAGRGGVDAKSTSASRTARGTRVDISGPFCLTKRDQVERLRGRHRKAGTHSWIGWSVPEGWISVALRAPDSR